MNVVCTGCGRTVGAPIRRQGKVLIVTTGWAVMCNHCHTVIMPGTAVKPAPKKKHR